MKMRCDTCQIAPFAIASLVSISPACAGSPLDFLENFQAVEIVLETNFTDSSLDKILAMTRVANISRPVSPESEIKKSIESAIANKDAENIGQFLSDSGNSCSLKNQVLSCHILKYEITRNVGNSDNPRLKRQYDYLIVVKNIKKSIKSVDVKYVYKDDGLSR